MLKCTLRHENDMQTVYHPLLMCFTSTTRRCMTLTTPTPGHMLEAWHQKLGENQALPDICG